MKILTLLKSPKSYSYSGHEDPVLNGGQDMIAMTLEHVLKSEIR